MEPVETRVVQTRDRSWVLQRGGSPYFVKGVGGTSRLERAAALGANSVRTWTCNDLLRVLDEAHALGLTVTAGLHVKSAASNQDWYSSAKHAPERAQKIADYVAVVRQHKHHPALLLWAVGNEPNAEGCNAFAPLYAFINEAALAVKAEDPHHAVATVTTSPTPEIAGCLNAHCPDVDVWGVNVYGPLLPKLAGKMRDVGWARCYCVTEYGPKNHWQARKTHWGAQLEPSSTEKAHTYKAAYLAQAADAAAPAAQCCGGYAFKWGWKEQVTVTWICLLNEYEHTLVDRGGTLRGGEETAALDELSLCWTGRPPANRAPEVRSLTLAGAPADASVRLRCSALHEARCETRDPDGDLLTFLWLLLREGGSKADREGVSWKGGVPTPIPGSVESSDASGQARIRVPAAPGHYRLYVWVSDGHGHVATMNLPFEAAAGDGASESEKPHQAGRGCLGTCMGLLK